MGINNWSGIGMTYERWVFLMDNPTSPFTEEEKALGWHGCYDFDQLIVGPGMFEFEEGLCTCIRRKI